MATRSSNAQARAIREYVIEHVSPQTARFTMQVAEKFGISRQAAHRYIKRLVNEGILTASGETKDRRYALKPIVDESFEIPITPKLDKDVVWRERVRPLLDGVDSEVLATCQYGFTEMLNNIIDHSVGTQATIKIHRTARQLKLALKDNGVGIFKKIQAELGLADERQAILELAKGKFTTDPVHHTGEGIFFTSRAFDLFTLSSGNLLFTHDEPGDDWLLEEEAEVQGTTVVLEIALDSKRTLKQVLDQYTFSQDEFGFSRTIVPVRLARYGDENLVSRSQAKRLLTRLQKFREVIFDFQDVETIGQAFADEIFRVFANEHPQVNLTWVNANDQVGKMILRAKANNV